MAAATNSYSSSVGTHYEIPIKMEIEVVVADCVSKAIQ